MIGVHAPAAGRLFERFRIACDETPALALEQRGIGLGQSAGVGNKSRRRKMDRAGEFTPQVGLAQLDRSVVEHLACDAILLRPLELAERFCKRSIGTIQLDPAGPPQQLAHAGLRDQFFMLDQAAPDQRQLGHRTLHRAFR